MGSLASEHNEELDMDQQQFNQGMQLTEGLNVKVGIPAPKSYQIGDDFKLWATRLYQYLNLLGLPANMRAEHLIVNLGNEAYRMFQSLEIDDDDMLDYHLLVDKLNEVLAPKESPTNLKYMFRNRKQKPLESIAEYKRALLELGAKAYPSQEENTIRKQLLLEGFTNGLFKGELIEQIILDPQILDIHQAAQKAENILLAKRTRDKIIGAHQPESIQVIRTAETKEKYERLRMREDIREIITQEFKKLNINGADNNDKDNSEAGWKCDICQELNQAHRYSCIKCFNPKTRNPSYQNNYQQRRGRVFRNNYTRRPNFRNRYQQRQPWNFQNNPYNRPNINRQGPSQAQDNTQNDTSQTNFPQVNTSTRLT